jgi:uncharacterized protein (TIGR03000 family)
VCRSAWLMGVAVLLVGPSCGECGSLAGLRAGRTPYDALVLPQEPTIYTPAYAPIYDGLYAPAYAPPLTRTYVPAYARTYPPANAAPPASPVVFPQPIEAAASAEASTEAPAAAPVPLEAKPTLPPVNSRSNRSVQDTGTATIVLIVSETAAVWINGRKTTSQGTQRTYSSVGLQKGLGYQYRIVVQDGARLIERVVVLTAGETRLVR